MEATQVKQEPNQVNRTWGEFFAWVWDQIVRLAKAGYKWCVRTFGFDIKWKKKQFIREIQNKKRQAMADNPQQAEQIGQFYDEIIAKTRKDFAETDKIIVQDFKS